MTGLWRLNMNKITTAGSNVCRFYLGFANPNFTAMQEHPVILFDGVCNFCNATINFIIKRDKKGVFRFAALQSEAGQQLLNQHGLSSTELDSFVLIYKGKAYKKTTAALHLYPQLGLFWGLIRVLWIFPAFIRDFGYDIIAKNRYRWFGKKETCMIPSPEIRSRFLQ
jgi:predicted DCC family thiol-disulfide oxidoreductase YuxK